MTTGLKADYPELQAAYAAEAEAVARVKQMAERRKAVKGEIFGLKRTRDMLAARMAKGEAVTGADLRQANQVIEDAEGTLTMLGEALPQAGTDAIMCSRHRATAEVHVRIDAHAPFREAEIAAQAELQRAQAAYDKAKADADTLPPEAAAEMAGVLLKHGRNEALHRETAAWAEIQQTNAGLRKFNEDHPRTFRPLTKWPGEPE